MLINIDRSLLSRSGRLRATYQGPVVAQNPSLTPVVNEFVKLAILLTSSMGKFTYSIDTGDIVTRTGIQLSNDFRLLVSLRDHLRLTGTASDTVSLLSASIKAISFRLAKAAAQDSEVADLYDVAGWGIHV